MADSISIFRLSTVVQKKMKLLGNRSMRAPSRGRSHARHEWSGAPTRMDIVGRAPAALPDSAANAQYIRKMPRRATKTGLREEKTVAIVRYGAQCPATEAERRHPLHPRCRFGR